MRYHINIKLIMPSYNRKTLLYIIYVFFINLNKNRFSFVVRNKTFIDLYRDLEWNFLLEKFPPAITIPHVKA